MTVKKECADGVMSIGEDVGLDHDAFTDRALGWKATAVYLRRDFLDDDTDSAHAGVLPLNPRCPVSAPATYAPWV
jgi:hypothetical protein